LKVVLVVDITGLKDKNIFDKHLKKEGFVLVESESFAYEGIAHSHLFNTRAYVLNIASKALNKSHFYKCSIMFQIGDNPMETYQYSKETKDFIKINI